MRQFKSQDRSAAKIGGAGRLNSRLEKHLLAYAAAAGAASVSVLVLAQPAEARIVYTPAHKVIQPNTPYQLDLNHDGTPDFVLYNLYWTSSGNKGASLRPVGPHGNAIADSASYKYALALKKGANIGSGLTFRSAFEAVMAAVSTSANGTERSRGPWINVANRYLGLRFNIKGQTHFGWARFTARASNDPPDVDVTLTGYAYETIANKPIVAGATHGQNDLSAQPATLGALAAGSSAISAWRPGERGSK